jgi:hypothetical protein
MTSINAVSANKSHANTKSNSKMNKQVVITGYSCSSSGYSSQSLSDFGDMNTNHQRKHIINSLSSLNSNLSNEEPIVNNCSSSQSSNSTATYQINSISCLRTSTPTNLSFSTYLNDFTNATSNQFSNTQNHTSRTAKSRIFAQSKSKAHHKTPIRFNETRTSSPTFDQKSTMMMMMTPYQLNSIESQKNAHKLMISSISTISTLPSYKSNVKQNPTSKPVPSSTQTAKSSTKSKSAKDRLNESLTKLTSVWSFLANILQILNVFDCFKMKKSKSEDSSACNENKAKSKSNKKLKLKESKKNKCTSIELCPEKLLVKNNSIESLRNFHQQLNHYQTLMYKSNSIENTMSSTPIKKSNDQIGLFDKKSIDDLTSPVLSHSNASIYSNKSLIIPVAASLSARSNTSSVFIEKETYDNNKSLVNRSCLPAQPTQMFVKNPSTSNKSSVNSSVSTIASTALASVSSRGTRSKSISSGPTATTYGKQQIVKTICNSYKLHDNLAMLHESMNDDEQHYIRINPTQVKLKQAQSISSFKTIENRIRQSKSLTLHPIRREIARLEHDEGNESCYDLQIIASSNTIVKPVLVRPSKSIGSVAFGSNIKKSDSNMSSYASSNSVLSPSCSTSSALSSSSASADMSNCSISQSNKFILAHSSPKKVNDSNEESIKSSYYLSLMNMNSARPFYKQDDNHNHSKISNEIKKEQNSFRIIEDEENKTSNQPKSKKIYFNKSRPITGEQQRKERRVEACKLNSFGELYEDYLCDKEVESYFDNSYPSSVNSSNKSKKIPLTPSFKTKPKETNHLASLYARKNLIACGYVRQCQGESYC